MWGRLDRAPNESEPVGFVFRAKGDRSNIELAERASRLGSGTEVAIDYAPVANGWNLASGLLPPP